MWRRCQLLYKQLERLLLKSHQQFVDKNNIIIKKEAQDGLQ